MIKSPLLLGVLVTGWLGAVVLGSWKLLDYEKTPGPTVAISQTWPVGAPIELDPVRPTLVMFLHPQCPCTKNTLDMLTQIVSHTGERLNITVFFLKPNGVSDNWLQSATWKQAMQIPNIRVRRDEGGQEAERFRATVSGQCLVYDPAGRLLFFGGITPSRGHIGSNAGERSVTAIAMHEKPERTSSSIFGCEIFRDRQKAGVA